MNAHEANDHVPPVVLFPTPPTTIAPNDKHPLVELHTLLQLPPPIKPSIVLLRFLNPPPFVERSPEVILQFPPKIDE